MIEATTRVDKDGCQIFPGVLSEHEIESILVELPSTIPQKRAGIRHMLGNQAVLDLANDQRLLGIAQEYLGAGAVPFHATLFSKTCAANWLVVWHQDTALPIEQKRDLPGWGPWSVKEGVRYAHAPERALREVLALRVHLDRSASDNGPLRVIPGTHQIGLLTDDAIHQIASESRPIDCTVPRGGVLAMRPLLIHASSKSESGAPRRVLHIEYASSVQTSDGLELAVG